MTNVKLSRPYRSIPDDISLEIYIEIETSKIQYLLRLIYEMQIVEPRCLFIKKYELISFSIDRELTFHIKCYTLIPLVWLAIVVFVVKKCDLYQVQKIFR